MAGRAIPTRLVGLVFGFAVLAAQPGRADDYPACAKIENPLAYNQCLANQGPPAHGTRSIAPPPDADAPKGAWRAPAAPGRTGSTIQVSRTRSGRMVIEFSIGGAAAASHKRKEAQ
jgi:hypothetical protein